MVFELRMRRWVGTKPARRPVIHHVAVLESGGTPDMLDQVWGWWGCSVVFCDRHGARPEPCSLWLAASGINDPSRTLRVLNRGV